MCLILLSSFFEEGRAGCEASRGLEGALGLGCSLNEAIDE